MKSATDSARTQKTTTLTTMTQRARRSMAVNQSVWREWCDELTLVVRRGDWCRCNELMMVGARRRVRGATSERFGRRLDRRWQPQLGFDYLYPAIRSYGPLRRLSVRICWIRSDLTRSACARSERDAKSSHRIL